MQLEMLKGGFEIVKESSIFNAYSLGTGNILYYFFLHANYEFFRMGPEAYYSLNRNFICTIIISIMTVFRGYFQGLQNMTPSAISQILEQIGRVIVGVGLAIVLNQRGIEYSAGGAAFGAAAGGLIGSIYLGFKYMTS